MAWNGGNFPGDQNPQPREPEGLGFLGGVTTSEGLRGRVAEILRAKREEANTALEASRRARGAADAEKRRKWLEERDNGTAPERKLVARAPEHVPKKKPPKQKKASYLTGGMVPLGPAIVKKRAKPKAPTKKLIGKAPRIDFANDILEESQMAVSNAYRQAVLESIWNKLTDQQTKAGVADENPDAVSRKAMRLERQLFNGVNDRAVYRSRAASMMSKLARGEDPEVPETITIVE